MHFHRSIPFHIFQLFPGLNDRIHSIYRNIPPLTYTYTHTYISTYSSLVSQGNKTGFITYRSRYNITCNIYTCIKNMSFIHLVYIQINLLPPPLFLSILWRHDANNLQLTAAAVLRSNRRLSLTFMISVFKTFPPAADWRVEVGWIVRWLSISISHLGSCGADMQVKGKCSTTVEEAKGRKHKKPCTLNWLVQFEVTKTALKVSFNSINKNTLSSVSVINGCPYYSFAEYFRWRFIPQLQTLCSV